MRYLAAILFAFIIYCPFAKAQTDAAQEVSQRNIPLKFVSQDSIIIPLNEDFDFIEDSCSQITRYARLDLNAHKYIGRVRDISKLDTTLTITDVTYNAQGQKEGAFVSRYLNGQLQATGSYNDDKYDGKWETYYEDGKPKLFFEADNGSITIKDQWDEKGKKKIDNGNGVYTALVGNASLRWMGKLVNGKPDGAWVCSYSADANQNELSSEKFKDGVFIKGRSPIADYTKGSRLLLISDTMLPFTRAELFQISRLPCSSDSKERIVNANYPSGMGSFTNEIVRLIRSSLSNVDLSTMDDYNIDGEINEHGMITNIRSKSTHNHTVPDSFASDLRLLPRLTPATLGGKPARQNIRLILHIGGGRYTLNYSLGQVFLK